jgi:hypothetical protein
MEAHYGSAGNLARLFAYTVLLVFLFFRFCFSEIGSGADPDTPPGGGGMASESVPVFDWDPFPGSGTL